MVLKKIGQGAIIFIGEDGGVEFKGLDADVALVDALPPIQEPTTCYACGFSGRYCNAGGGKVSHPLPPKITTPMTVYVDADRVAWTGQFIEMSGMDVFLPQPPDDPVE